ncbi:MAG: TauD/TfdA family dioxygenase [Alphaproteobacteria bacterium]|jgi:taurine dioxygenase|nr:TauD/TfdA family dioxygenase [Alphaproteobacteria bacterium]
MTYETIGVRRLAGAIGAEITGVDLAGPLSNRQAAEVHQALNEHLAIFFRDQELTPEQEVEVGRLFGEPYQIPFVTPKPGYPEIVEIVREPEDAGKPNFGGDWHSDMSFQECPPMGSVLYALEIPPYGGDTIWVNMEAAFEALSAGMKAMLDGLMAYHSGQRSYGSKGRFADADNEISQMRVAADESGDALVAHPVVRRHPETGRRGLFINPIYTIRFIDMSEAESLPILDYLFEHALRPEFSCRFRWSWGAVAIWDNRNTMHYAIADYEGQRRVANRVTIAGDQPH